MSSSSQSSLQEVLGAKIAETYDSIEDNPFPRDLARKVQQDKAKGCEQQSPVPSQAITFKGEHLFLSNFSPYPIEINYQGVILSMLTAEHALQAMKAAVMLDTTPQDQLDYVNQVSRITAPEEARKMGSSINIDKARWESILLACVRRVVDLKFSQNEKLKGLLLNTGNSKLTEDTALPPEVLEGKPGLLSEILMEYRNHIRKNS